MIDVFVSDYAEAIDKYLAQPDEEGREHAYEIGRVAIQQGLGVLDLARVHSLALETLAPERSTGTASWAFFAEVLAPFEMALRGVRDANATLKRFNQLLEERVDERTAALRATERELEEQGQLLRSVLDSMADGVLVIDTDDRVALINRAGEGMFELRVGSVAGSRAPQIPVFHTDMRTPVPPEDRPYARALRGEMVLDAEVYVSRREGEGQFLRISAAPLRRDGELRGVVMVCSDWTARHRAEEAAQRAEERLVRAQKLDAIGQLAGGVAHDFNNLLAAILSYCDLLAQELPAASTAAADVREIRHAATSAASLTRQLLAFSRQQVLQLGPLSLNEVVDDTVRMLRRTLGEHVHVETRLDPSLPPVLADRGQMEQVLMNLAVNARDAMPAGGHLVIETRSHEAPEGEALGRVSVVEGELALLTVSDTGTGMDAATLARIFEPFFTTKERGRGTGLGLATVYGIVQQSGGHVSCYSEPGCGTTFRVYLPWAKAAPRPLGPARSPSVGGTETVLLVEDEERLRVVGSRVLRGSGYRVLSADGPAAARALSSEHAGPIDLLITDVVMPGGSGGELARALTAERPAMRVLFVSGYASAGATASGHVAEGAAFLEKPFTADALRTRVRQVLDREKDTP